MWYFDTAAEAEAIRERAQSWPEGLHFRRKRFMNLATNKRYSLPVPIHEQRNVMHERQSGIKWFR